MQLITYSNPKLHIHIIRLEGGQTKVLQDTDINGMNIKGNMKQDIKDIRSYLADN